MISICRHDYWQRPVQAKPGATRPLQTRRRLSIYMTPQPRNPARLNLRDPRNRQRKTRRNGAQRQPMDHSKLQNFTVSWRKRVEPAPNPLPQVGLEHHRLWAQILIGRHHERLVEFKKLDAPGLRSSLRATSRPRQGVSKAEPVEHGAANPVACIRREAHPAAGVVPFQRRVQSNDPIADEFVDLNR
jgi:hypothetical protein